MLDHHDHDHQQCRTTALARVEQRCAREGLRLTAQRRQVLEVMLESHAPVTAYEIMDRIGSVGRRPSPISVYRALDFLVSNRFAHRIESRNAFLACNHEHEGPGAAGNGALVFLLCESCGAAEEAEPPGLAVWLDRLAEASGFRVGTSVLEVRGLCAACQARGVTLAPPAVVPDIEEPA